MPSNIASSNMSNRFLNTGGGNLTNGTANLYVAAMTVRGLDPSLPVKTNGQRTLVAEKLDIADVNSLQAELNAKLTNPLDMDFDFQGYKGTNIGVMECVRGGPVAAPADGLLTLYANEGDGLFHQVNAAGLDQALGAEYSTAVYKPGAASTGNIYGTWSKVVAAVNAFTGRGIIYIDDSLVSPAVMNEDLNCRGLIDIIALKNTAASPALLQFATDVQMIDVLSFQGTITILTDAQTRPNLLFKPGAVFELLTGASLNVNTICNMPPVSVSSSLVLLVDLANMSNFDNPSVAAVEVKDGATLIFVNLALTAQGLTNNLVSSEPGASSGILIWIKDATAMPITFPNWAFVIYDSNLAKAQFTFYEDHSANPQFGVDTVQGAIDYMKQHPNPFDQFLNTVDSPSFDRLGLNFEGKALWLNAATGGQSFITVSSAATLGWNIGLNTAHSNSFSIYDAVGNQDIIKIDAGGSVTLNTSLLANYGMSLQNNPLKGASEIQWLAPTMGELTIAVASNVGSGLDVYTLTDPDATPIARFNVTDDSYLMTPTFTVSGNLNAGGSIGVGYGGADEWFLPTTKGAAGAVLQDLAGDGHPTWEVAGGDATFNNLTVTGLGSFAFPITTPGCRSVSLTTGVDFNTGNVVMSIPIALNGTGSAPTMGYALDLDGHMLAQGRVASNVAMSASSNAFNFGTVGTGFNGGATDANIAVAGVNRVAVGSASTVISGAPCVFNASTNSYTMPTTRSGAGGVLYDSAGDGTLTWTPVASVLPTPSYGELYWQGNLTHTTIATINTYVSMAGTRVGGICSNFTAGATNLTYSGSENRILKCTMSVTFYTQSGSTHSYQMAIHQNGAAITSSQIVSMATTNYATITSTCLMSVVTGDTIGALVMDLNGNAHITIYNLSLNAITLQDSGVMLAELSAGWLSDGEEVKED